MFFNLSSITCDRTKNISRTEQNTYCEMLSHHNLVRLRICMLVSQVFWLLLLRAKIFRLIEGIITKSTHVFVIMENLKKTTPSDQSSIDLCIKS